MFGFCKILGLFILELMFGIITSTFKVSLNHALCDELQGTILLAAGQMENYTPQIDHTRNWDEE